MAGMPGEAGLSSRVWLHRAARHGAQAMRDVPWHRSPYRARSPVTAVQVFPGIRDTALQGQGVTMPSSDDGTSWTRPWRLIPLHMARHRRTYIATYAFPCRDMLEDMTRDTGWYRSS